MDYIKNFLHVEGTIGQGAFGRVLVTSSLQNTVQSGPQPQQEQELEQLQHQQKLQQHRRYSLELNRSPPQPISVGNLSYQGHLSAGAEENPTSGQTPRQNSNTNSDQVARRFALKCVHPILKPQRLANELRHLRDLGGQHNVVRMHTAYINKGSLYIVMDLFEHDRFNDIVAQLEYEEIVMYMENLLDALEHVHSYGIMHRDIKPGNFLFNRKNKKFLLIDFGLAHPTLFGNRACTASTPIAKTITMLLPSAPTTPTSNQTRRHIPPLTPEFPSKRHDNYSKFNKGKPLSTPFINFSSTTHIIHQSPARHLINFTPNGSPNAPNVGTKRQRTDVGNTNVDQMLKKLCVSNKEEIREPVKLTVGAYESPITNGDCSNKRANSTHKSHKFSTPIVPSRRSSNASCECRGRPMICSNCQSKPDSHAPKSGTPGYKAPEILLRYTKQTTAVDVWSAGVIFACLLSGHSPFLRDSDDTASLAEIITLLGSHRVVQAARAMAICLNIEPKREPVDLMQLCKRIRLNNKDKRQIEIPDEAFDLLNRMLDPNPLTRITARDALKEHPWLKNCRTSEPIEE